MRDWWIVIVVAAGARAVVVRPQAARSGLPRALRRMAAAARSSSAPLVARLETARLARTLGTLLRNGVPLLTALGIAPQRDGEPDAGQADVEAAAERGEERRRPVHGARQGQAVPAAGAADDPGGRGIRRARHHVAEGRRHVRQPKRGNALDRMLAALVPRDHAGAGRRRRRR